MCIYESMNDWYQDCPCQVCPQNLQGRTETGLGQVEVHHCFHCSEKMLLNGHWMWWDGWDGHLVGGAGAGVGDGAAGAAEAAPPCLITRWTVIPSWNINIEILSGMPRLHLNVVGGEWFVVLHYLAGEDEAKIFNRSAGKLCRNGFLELRNKELVRAKNAG